MQHRETERWTAVVDDDAYAREACVALLRAHDFTARGFASAREFLEASRGAMPDALVLDVDIPEI